MGEGLNIKSISDGCMMVLHYFGIFKYPLNPEEVHRFNPYKTDLDSIIATLSELCENQEIYSCEEYYLKENDHEWIKERKAGNERAVKLLKRSKKYTRIIASFPFVRGIAISGSLSKMYASQDPDIDYFIIAEKDRLWIARSFLHFFKKLTFITGHQHYFCMNYFIDTDALSIEHPNLYSAIEMKTLLPVYNKGLMEQFAASNSWTDEYLPNHPGADNFTYLLRERRRPCKAAWEALFNLLFPDRINRFFMNLTDKKWRRKWRRSGYDMNEYDRAFRTGIHISKNHPADYQKLVLESLPDKLKTQDKK